MGKAGLTHAAKWVLITGVMALTGACTTPGSGPSDLAPNPPASPPTEEGCAANAYQHFVGQRIGEIHIESLPAPLRIYATTDMITMDYRMERMNIVTTPEGVVVEVKCG